MGFRKGPSDRKNGADGGRRRQASMEIEIARGFVSLWKSSRDKFRQRFAERIERQPHSARGRDRRYVASRWEFETWSHESLA